MCTFKPCYQSEISILGLRFSAKKNAVVQLAGDFTADLSVALNGEQLIRQSVNLGVQLSMAADMYTIHDNKLGLTGLRAQCILRRRCFGAVIDTSWRESYGNSCTYLACHLPTSLHHNTHAWLGRQRGEVACAAFGCPRESGEQNGGRALKRGRWPVS